MFVEKTFATLQMNLQWQNEHKVKIEKGTVIYTRLDHIKLISSRRTLRFWSKQKFFKVLEKP